MDNSLQLDNSDGRHGWDFERDEATPANARPEMKTLLLLLLLFPVSAASPLAPSAPTNSPAPDAGVILLKSGVKVSAEGLARKEDMLTVSVKTSTGSLGTVSYHVGDVAELDLPLPPEIESAAGLIAQGHADQALAQAGPIVDFQQTLRDIPGNDWARMALVKCSALTALNRGAEAASLLKEIAGYSKEPEIQLAAKLQLTLLQPPKDPTEALAAYDAVIDQGSDPKTLTQAWMAEGDVRFGEHAFDEALLAYLTVPVFFPDNNPQMPRALWGVAQSYAKLKDAPNQEKALHELVSHYPDSPEASLAKAELLKMENKT
jgi:tetratricopeptide (TPR) repeat protein